MRRARSRWLVALVALGALTGCGTSTAPSGSPLPSPTPSTPRSAEPTVSPCPPTSSPACHSGSPATPTPTATVTPTSVPGPTSEPSPAPTANPSVPADLFGTDWTALPTSRLVVALTFDCGASDAGVASILDTLAGAGVSGTFFVTGAFARSYPADVAAIAAAGHAIGNHSDTHEHYPQLTDAQIAEDLAVARAAIRAAGADPGPWFRFPYGDRTDADVRAVNAAGYIAVRWTVDTLGWQGTSGGRSAAEVVDRVLDAATPGEIVLMHVGANPDDGTTLDADALPAAIAGLRAAGYGFTTVEALLDG